MLLRNAGAGVSSAGMERRRRVAGLLLIRPCWLGALECKRKRRGARSPNGESGRNGGRRPRRKERSAGEVTGTNGMRQGLPGAVRGRALPDGFLQARHGACAQALAWRLGVVSGRGVAVVGQSVPMHLWLWQPARAEGCRSLTERVERTERE